MMKKLGSKGEVIIPKEFRDQLGLQKGSALILQLHGRTITITAESAHAAAAVKGQSKGPTKAREIDWDRLGARLDKK